MIIVRNVFRLKFGKAKEAKMLAKEAQELNKKHGVKSSRILVDLIGHSYTLVFESGHESLGAFESKMQDMSKDSGFSVFYEKFKPLCDSAFTEIFTVVE